MVLIGADLSQSTLGCSGAVRHHFEKARQQLLRKFPSATKGTFYDSSSGDACRQFRLVQKNFNRPRERFRDCRIVFSMTHRAQTTYRQSCVTAGTAVFHDSSWTNNLQAILIGAEKLLTCERVFFVTTGSLCSL